MDEFVDHLRYDLEFRKETIRGYKAVLSKLRRDLGTLKITKEDATKYMADMRRKEYSASHINNTSVIIERWLCFNDIEVKLKRVKKPKPSVKDTLTEGEIARIMAAADNIREKAMIAILAYSGIRNKELCNLRVRDIDFDRGLIRVIDGKGGKDRVAYVPRECTRILTRYLSEHQREDDGYLFTTLVRNNRYGGWALRKMLKKIAKKAGIVKRVYPHLFRHSLATNLIKRGANVVTVQNQLGHERLDTTMVYIRSIPERIQAEYQYYVPNYV